MKTVIHVNQHLIKSNQKKILETIEVLEPVLSVKNYKCTRYADEAIILDKNGEEVAKIVYSPEKPLACGARCWIETQNEVEIVRKKSENNTE